MKTIPLTHGYVALIDDDDYELVSRFTWHASIRRRSDGSIRNVYARTAWLIPGTQKNRSWLLHRMILKLDDLSICVDHRDHNGLNCQRNNLRLATNRQNSHNMRKRRNCLSRYKGVSFSRGKWISLIRVNGKNKFLGYYKEEIDAARAYQKAATHYFGEFAHTEVL